MSQGDFAEKLSAVLQFRVSQVNVSNWLKGSEPRPRKNMPDIQERVLAAAQQIAATVQADDSRQRQVPGAKVAAKLKEWVGQGLTPHQIQVAGEIPATLYTIWENGQVAVPANRWAQVLNKVEAWKQYVLDKKET